MRKFKAEMKEGKVYKITYFAVVDNAGRFRASSHEFKIQFTTKTRVVQEECDSIPMYGLSLKTAYEITYPGCESDFLTGWYTLINFVLGFVHIRVKAAPRCT